MQIKTLFFEGSSKQSVLLDVRLTESFIERNRGLLALPPLSEGEGLLINPCSSIHTFSMKYPLDLVYLDKALKIVKIVENIAANRVSLCWRAKSTLELKSGEVERLKLSVGLKGKFLE